MKGETSQQVMPLPLPGQTGAALWCVVLGMRRPDQGWCDDRCYPMHNASLSHIAEKKKTGQIMKEKVTLDIKGSEIIVRFLGYQDDGGMVATIIVEVV